MESYKCVNQVSVLDHSMELMVRAVQAYRDKGVLPFSGGFLEQPKVFGEVLHIFDITQVLVTERKKTRRRSLTDMLPKDPSKS